MTASMKGQEQLQEKVMSELSTSLGLVRKVQLDYHGISGLLYVPQSLHASQTDKMGRYSGFCPRFFHSLLRLAD
jgi:hypothetical protein